MKATFKEMSAVFFKAFLISIFMIVPYLFLNQGVLNIQTDFQLQQIPFGVANNLAIKEGSVFWEPFNELGSSFIGSYSFYTLGSPFYWLSLLFPAHYYPYLLSLLLMLKFAVASLTAYCYIKGFVRDSKYAVWGGWLYAFSGFQLTNMGFNHFHDVTALFPLLLLTLDATFLKQKRGWFGLVVGLLALTNYYFFTIEVLFLVVYTLINLLTKRYQLTRALFIQLAIESLLGVGMACFLLLPSFLFILDNPRTDNSVLTILFDPDQFYIYPVYYLELIRSLFTLPQSMNYGTGHKLFQYTSFSLWIPLVGINLSILSYKVLRVPEWKWLKYLMVVFITCLLIPLLGLSFMFYVNFTLRWLFPFLLLLALVFAITLEESVYYGQHLIAPMFQLSLVIVIELAIIDVGQAMDGYSLAYWVRLIILFIQCLMFYYLLKTHSFESSQGHQRIFKFTPISIVLSGNAILFLSQFVLLEPYEAYDYTQKTEISTYLETHATGRLDPNRIQINRHFNYQLPATTGFNSNIQGSLFELYKTWFNLDRGVFTCSNVSPLFYYQTAMSAQYVIDYQPNQEVVAHCAEVELSYPKLTQVAEDEYYILYENEGYIPMGFTYEHYLDWENFEQLDYFNRQPYWLHALILTPEQIEKYQGWLTPVKSHIAIDDPTYWQDVEDRRSETCHSFEYTKDGATCQIQLKQPNLVFFSIPYDKGWRAFVNEKEVTVEKVSGGLMAIPVSSTDPVEINLIYRPTGLQLGSFITLFSLSAYTLYWLFPLLKPKKTSV